MVGVRLIQVLEVADFEDVEELGDVRDAFVGVVVVFSVESGEADEAVGFAVVTSEAGWWGDDAFFGAYQGAPGRLPQGRGLSHDAL